MLFTPKFINRVRKEFPRVESDPTGRKRAFLDNGAGTLVTRRSVEREAAARVQWSANVGNVFPESIGAENVILEGRKAVADLLRSEGPETIISGESCTSLLFSLSYALSRTLTGEENVVLTGYEHYANINPWVELGGMQMITEVRFAPFNLNNGLLDMEELKRLVDRKTKVVAVSAASNVLGTRSDLKEISNIAHEAGALLVVDAVHHVAHGPLDVQKLGCDALVFSGYKLFSRHGSFMYLKPDLVEKLHPYKVEASPKHGPEKWEWGTRDQAMFAAVTGAIDYLTWLGDPLAKETSKAGPQRGATIRKAMIEIEAYEKELSRILLDGYGNIMGLRYIPGLTLYGPREAHSRLGRDPTFSFKIAGWDDRELAKLLWEKYSLAVGAEDYYSRVPAQYGQKTMLRATFVHYNTKQEALAFLQAIARVARKEAGPVEPFGQIKKRPVKKSPSKKKPVRKKVPKKKHAAKKSSKKTPRKKPVKKKLLRKSKKVKKRRK